MHNLPTEDNSCLFVLRDDTKNSCEGDYEGPYFLFFFFFFNSVVLFFKVYWI